MQNYKYSIESAVPIFTIPKMKPKLVQGSYTIPPDSYAIGNSGISEATIVSEITIDFKDQVFALNIDERTHQDKICPCCFRRTEFSDTYFYYLHCEACGFDYLTKKDDYPLVAKDRYFFDYLKYSKEFRVIDGKGAILSITVMEIRNMNEMIAQCNSTLKTVLFL